MLQAFVPLTAQGHPSGRLPEVAFCHMQLWGAALPRRTVGAPCIYDGHGRVGICGDWLLGSSMEAAALSGKGMAERLRRATDNARRTQDDVAHAGAQDGGSEATAEPQANHGSSTPESQTADSADPQRSQADGGVGKVESPTDDSADNPKTQAEDAARAGPASAGSWHPHADSVGLDIGRLDDISATDIGQFPQVSAPGPADLPGETTAGAQDSGTSEAPSAEDGASVPVAATSTSDGDAPAVAAANEMELADVAKSSGADAFGVAAASEPTQPS